MLIFCDESWKENSAGKKVGTLAAVAIEPEGYIQLADRVFLTKERYFGFENARDREIKGKNLISRYEFRRQQSGEVSIKLAFARDILESIKSLGVSVFASVVYREEEVDLLCEDPGKLDRAYWFLLERFHEFVLERSDHRVASVVFDDRGLTRNQAVGAAYGNFLARSRTGRSYHTLLRHPLFAYSHHSVGLQLADLVCTIVNRFHTARGDLPGIEWYYGLVKSMEWVSSSPNSDGFVLRGIKVLGDAK